MPEFVLARPAAWTGTPAERCLSAACAPIHSGAVLLQGGLAVTVGADSLPR
jgi:hypothetical protein